MRKAQVCGTRKYNLRINTPKIGHVLLQINQSIALWVSGNANICVILSQVGFPGWVHMCGFDVWVDQNDQKVDYEQSPPNLTISNLGTPRTQEIFRFWNFPNSLYYQKLNAWECLRINYLVFMGQFFVLGVPRLLDSLLIAIFVHFAYFVYFLA